MPSLSPFSTPILLFEFSARKYANRYFQRRSKGGILKSIAYRLARFVYPQENADTDFFPRLKGNFGVKRWKDPTPTQAFKKFKKHLKPRYLMTWSNKIMYNLTSKMKFKRTYRFFNVEFEFVFGFSNFVRISVFGKKMLKLWNRLKVNLFKKFKVNKFKI